MRRRTWVLTAALIACAAPVDAATAAAPTGWTSPKAVQPGRQPRLAIGPDGTVGIESIAGSKVIVSRRSRTGRIGHRVTFAVPGRHLAPAALALAGDGTAALAFADPTGPAPVLARLLGPTATAPGHLQTLIGAGHAATGQGGPDTVRLLTTPQGTIVGAGADGAGALMTLRRAAGAGRISTAAAPRELGASDAYALAIDPSGDRFLAGDGPTGCTAVAYGPPDRPLTTTYTTGNCASATPNLFDAIAAGPHGGAALLSEDVSEAGTGATRLLAQIGHDGHFGPATTLGTGALLGPVGLAADATGGLVAEWTNCAPGPVQGAQLTYRSCAIVGATGTVTDGFAADQAPGQPLLAQPDGDTVSADTAPGGLVAARCRAGSCGLYAFTVAVGGGFRAAAGLGGARALLSLTGDGHGHLLALWLDPAGRLTAATASVADGRWTVHPLSRGGVGADDVAAVQDRDGRALVAWSQDGQVELASGP